MKKREGRALETSEGGTPLVSCNESQNLGSRSDPSSGRGRVPFFQSSRGKVRPSSKRSDLASGASPLSKKLVEDIRSSRKNDLRRLGPSVARLKGGGLASGEEKNLYYSLGKKECVSPKKRNVFLAFVANMGN